MACHTSTFWRKPDVPGFMPGMACVGTSTVDTFSEVELPELDDEDERENTDGVLVVPPPLTWLRL